MKTVEDILEDKDGKEFSILFLKKLLNLNNNTNFLEIKKALNLEFISNHLKNIKIKDIYELNENKTILTKVKSETYKIDIIDKNIDLNNNIFKRNIIYEQIYNIIIKNNSGIRTNEIVKCIGLNKDNKTHHKIFYRLSELKKYGYISYYKNGKNFYWIKSK